MTDSHLLNTKSPKYYVKRWLDLQAKDIAGKKVIDLPAGNGVTSQLLNNHGALVFAFDLFPEYFKIEELECRRADIATGIPLDDNFADMAICQEGIEHFSDQLRAFKEFNRVLKIGAKLLITTPSYSNLSSRFSYFLFESETNKHMPPNEIDDIWMEDKSISQEIYHGHIFLIGLQKLRILAKLSGFKIHEIKYIRLSKGSLFLLPFYYPLILFSSYLRYRRNMKKNPNISVEYKQEVYREQFKINTSVRNLINHHTFIVFEKENNYRDVNFRHDSTVVDFGAKT
jgi:ubiquinone/menaquinone biosynthesis C-methylase UbiE